jgi:hypothetical protein
MENLTREEQEGSQNPYERKSGVVDPDPVESKKKIPDPDPDLSEKKS